MDVSLVHAVFIIFGSLPPIFAEDNIRHRGFVTSLSEAKEVCGDRTETLVTAENDEKRKKIIKVLAENKLDAAWLFTNFITLRNWTFTDGSQTILSESKINVTQGAHVLEVTGMIYDGSTDVCFEIKEILTGLCGALIPEDSPLLFKSLPCNRKLVAVKNLKGCSPSCHQLYNGTNKYRWHSLNKGILGTPYKNNVTSFAGFLHFSQATGINQECWISLRKFQFTWPDGTEIPLQQWEDRSKNKGDCLILRKNEEMVVVDCETSSNHSVLCSDKGSGESSSQVSGLKVTISVLGVVCGLLLVAALFIAYSWFQPKCPLGRQQENNQDNQESRQEDNQEDNQDNQAEQRPTYEEITDVRLGLKAA